MSYGKKEELPAGEAAVTGGPGDYSANPCQHLRVPVVCHGRRVDQVLASLLPQHSRSRLQTWIRDGRVRIDGRCIVEPRQKLSGGESVQLVPPRSESHEMAAAEHIPLQVLYEDESLLVIDKPPGLVVHPGNGNRQGTLLNGLLHHAPALAAVPRAGIVHRLDKDTSGLLVVARTLEAQTDLVRQLQERSVRRHYFALVRGVLDLPGTIDAPIGRHRTVRTRMAVVASGRPARTHYRISARFAACTLLECALETGRTHQIRVHLASIGHPLVGDSTYGGSNRVSPPGPQFSRQALHAWQLALRHPHTGETLQWLSRLPDDMLTLLAGLRAQMPTVAHVLPAGAGDWPQRMAAGPELESDLLEDGEQGEQ